MKVTVYTTPTCQFSKKEKDYLSTKGVSFEEKNLEADRANLTEMLALSENFAGTPVTKIEKDDGSVSVLKGFTQSEFDAILGPGMVTASAPVVDEPAQTPAPQPPTPPTPDPVPPAPEPMPQPPKPEEPPIAEPVAPATSVAAAPDPTTPPVPQSTPIEEPKAPEEPAAPVAPVEEPKEPVAPVQTPSNTPPTVPAETNNALDSILKDLQKRVNDTYSAADQGAQTPAPQPVDMPKEPATPATPQTPTTPPSSGETPSTPAPQPTPPGQVPEVPSFPAK